MEKVEDAAVLQETADDAADPDRFRKPRDARPEAADAADDQVDLHAGLRRQIEAVDHQGIDQGVGFDDDVRRPAGPGRIDLTVDVLFKLTAQPVRGDGQMMPGLRCRVARQHVKESRCVFADVFGTGHQAHVCVKAGGDVVVVAGAQVDITADAVFVPADHKRDLAVGLKANQAVDHVAAGLLELAGPMDVVLLVETGFELDQHHDLLALTGGLGQAAYDRRLSADAVQRLLDRQDVGIAGGLLHQLDHRIKRLEGMMQVDIPLANGIEKVQIILKLERRGRIGQIDQFGALVVIVQLVEACQVERPVDRIDVFFADAQQADQLVLQVRVHVLFHFKTDHLSPLAHLE